MLYFAHTLPHHETQTDMGAYTAWKMRPVSGGERTSKRTAINPGNAKGHAMEHIDKAKEKKMLVFRYLLFTCAFIILMRMLFLGLDKILHPDTRRTYDTSLIRGEICDRNGKKLTSDELTYTVCIDKTKLETKEDGANIVRFFANELDIDVATLGKKLLSKRENVVVQRKLSEEKHDEMLRVIRKERVKGVYFYEERKRFYPKKEVFAHLTGFVNIDNKGAGGVEYKYDEYLNPRRRKDGRAYNVFLTVNSELQSLIHKEMEDWMKTTKSEAAMAIVEDVNTGEILASVSYPFYDPNNLSQYTRSQLSNVLRNRAIMDSIEPGSTFKIFAGALALERGYIEEGERFCTPGYYEYKDGHRIHDSVSGKCLSFEEVFKYSCNYAIIKIAEERFGRKEFYTFLKRFHFGEKTGINTTGEERGILRNDSKWTTYSKGYISIGHEIAVTPLQLVNAYSALVNGGYFLTPRLVKEIQQEDGTIVKTFPPLREKILAKDVVDGVKLLLEKGVEQGATGERASLKSIKVMGKTGTAQRFAAGGYLDDQYNSLFVGAFPMDKPVVAIVVVIMKPQGQHTGGRVAAPLFKNIALHVIPTLHLKPENVVVVTDDILAEYTNSLHNKTPLPEDDTMPSLAGYSLRHALAVLAPLAKEKHAKIHVNVVSVAEDALPQGERRVCMHSPKTGEDVRENETITLTLCTTKARVGGE